METGHRPFAGEGKERRYYPVPDDRAIKVGGVMWAVEMPLGACYEIVGVALGTSTRLAITVWHGHYVATLYTSEVYSAPQVQAVSGWGDTASQAMVELAYRWHVLMGRSWLTDNHVVRKHLREIVTNRVISAIESLR